MKTIRYFFVMAVILIAGCATDDTLFETPDNPGLKKAKVPVPFKADCWAIPDINSDPILIEGLDPNNPSSYFLSRMLIGGTGTHLGRINPDESYYLFERSVLVFIDGLPHVELSGRGKVVGANGDGIEFTFLSHQALLGEVRSFIGKSQLIPGSGTGKFTGLVGSYDTNGASTPDGVWFKAEGNLVFE